MVRPQGKIRRSLSSVGICFAMPKLLAWGSVTSPLLESATRRSSAAHSSTSTLVFSAFLTNPSFKTETSPLSTATSSFRNRDVGPQGINLAGALIERVSDAADLLDDEPHIVPQFLHENTEPANLSGCIEQPTRLPRTVRGLGRLL